MPAEDKERVNQEAIVDPTPFICGQLEAIAKTVGDKRAITALSGGVDSSATTVLGYRALGKRLKVVCVENGLMRENEISDVAATFRGMRIPVEVIEAQEKFFSALKGLVDPEKKREAITQTFYKDVFAEAVRESGARYLLQGTILTDVEETVARIKRQHNVLAQLGIDTEKEFGYGVIEPLVTLRKDGVREVAKALGLPERVYRRMPFPGPALATRIIGEVTPERVATVRKATSIVEEVISQSNPKAFQYFAVLMNDRGTGIVDGKRAFGQIIMVRSIDSIDARAATPTEVPWNALMAISRRITSEVPGVVRVGYDIGAKPPGTVEYI